VSEEVWLPVVGYEGCYEVSSFGRVRSVDRLVKSCSGRIESRLSGKLLFTKSYTNGYSSVMLSRGGYNKNHFIHRLVATAFINNPLRVNVVNHLDRDKTNNHVDNLEWCTPQGNTRHWMEDEGLLSRSNMYKEVRGIIAEEIRRPSEFIDAMFDD